MASPPVPKDVPTSDPAPTPAATARAEPAPGPISAENANLLQTAKWWRVIPVVALGLMLATLDQSAVGVANQAIADEFGLNNVDIQAIGNANRISRGVVIPACIWLCSRFGLRRIFLTAMVLYAVTSALCGIAENLPVLVAFRVLQGIPGALAAIACTYIMQIVLPPERRGVGMLLMVMLVLCAPGFSPTIGGFLVSEWGWRWVFFIVVPFAVLGLLGGLALLPPLPAAGAPPFDWLGFLCIGTAVGCLAMALAKGSAWGWSSYPILVLLAVGVDAVILFVIVERQTTYPLIDQRVFRCQPFVVGLVIVEVFLTCLAVLPAYMPPFLQQVQGMTALQSGLMLAPQAVAWILSVPLAGVLMLKLGTRWCIVIGGTIVGTGTIALSYLMVVSVDWTLLAGVMAARAVGLGLVMLPLFGGMVSSLTPDLMNAGTMVRTMVQRVGSGMTLSWVSAMVANSKQQTDYDRSILLDPARAPQLHEESQKQLLGLWQQTQNYATAQVYSEVFLYIGWATLVGLVVLAFVARWGEPPRTDRYVIQDGA